MPVARAGLMAQVDFPAARHEGTRAVLVANSGKGETKSLLSRILCSRYWGTGDAIVAFSLSAVQAPSAGATCTCRHWHEGGPARGGRAASLAASAVPVGLALLQEARSPILGRLAIGLHVAHLRPDILPLPLLLVPEVPRLSACRKGQAGGVHGHRLRRHGSTSLNGERRGDVQAIQT